MACGRQWRSNGVRIVPRVRNDGRRVERVVQRHVADRLAAVGRGIPGGHARRPVQPGAHVRHVSLLRVKVLPVSTLAGATGKITLQMNATEGAFGTSPAHGRSAGKHYELAVDTATECGALTS